MKQLSFLVPLYNEEKNISLTVSTIYEAATFAQLNFDIIITDDASTDNSFKVAEKLATRYKMIRLFQNKVNLGFAKTYLNCLAQSTSNSVMYISSDNDIDRKNLELILSQLDKAPIVLQYCSNQYIRNSYRKYLSKIYTCLINKITRNNILYYNGFNIYPTEAVKNLNLTESSFAFQAEIASQLIKKYRYIEIGVDCFYNDKNSNALRIKNIIGVCKYLLKKLIT